MSKRCRVNAIAAAAAGQIHSISCRLRVQLLVSLIAVQVIAVTVVALSQSGDPPPRVVTWSADDGMAQWEASLGLYRSNCSDTGYAIPLVDRGRPVVPPPSAITLSADGEISETLIELQSVTYGDDCAETFLSHYETFCETALKPGSGGDRRLETERRVFDGAATMKNRRLDRELCPCVPRQYLVGRVCPNANSTVRNATYGPLEPGGHWSPSECQARQRLAIIVPFRDREANLQVLLGVLHPMLQRQLVDYTIFVVEQDEPRHIFNKAYIMNVGFAEVQSMAMRSSKAFDCVLFHDVDMLPEDDRNFYGCGARLPRHVGAYVDKWNYRTDGLMFGGVTSFRPDVFELINGFSNEFYGWGGEDDDMYYRIRSKNLSLIRFPKCVSGYTMIRHQRDKRNPVNTNRVKTLNKPVSYDRNGLNSLQYKLVAIERRPLYTWILVSLPPPPS